MSLLNKKLESYYRRKIAQGYKESYFNQSSEACVKGVVVRKSMGRGYSPVDIFIDEVENILKLLTNREREIIETEYTDTGSQNDKALSLNISVHTYRETLCSARKKLKTNGFLDNTL